ncbi:ATP-binding protein [Ferrimicrobium sp.]|uniref:ATP-binding protein n=1 Tax=Ferrimicrobium sp. TaxID=2926050 RepID=UPI0034DB1AB3
MGGVSPTLPIEPLGSTEILATFDDRGENGSIICSQLSLSAREESFEESTVAGAIMDRMIHTAIPVEGKGASMHKQPRQSNRAKATAPKQRSQRKEASGPTDPGPAVPNPRR